MLVNAQNLPCERLFANYPAPKVSFTSLDQTITSSMSVDGQSAETVMRQVIDYTNRRLYQENSFGSISNIMRYQAGTATMSMKVGDRLMDVPMPEGQDTSSFESLFDQGIVQGLPTSPTVVSCDGQQSYAGLLSGEQATITTEAPSVGTIISRVIFDVSGKPLGAVSTAMGMDMLMVFEEMTLDDQNVPVHIKLSMYQLTGEEANLLSITTTDTTSYNQPVDESLFAE